MSFCFLYQEFDHDKRRYKWKDGGLFDIELRKLIATSTLKDITFEYRHFISEILKAYDMSRTSQKGGFTGGRGFGGNSGRGFSGSFGGFRSNFQGDFGGFRGSNFGGNQSKGSGYSSKQGSFYCLIFFFIFFL